MGQGTDGGKKVLCAYMAGKDGMVRLRMPFGKEQLEALMKQHRLPELVVFLDTHMDPVLVLKGGRIQSCVDEGLGREVGRLLEQRKGKGYGGDCG